MKTAFSITVLAIGLWVFGLVSCSMEETKTMSKAAPAKASAPAKAAKVKPVKVSGSLGLVDTEKNYMIVVTKDGKLVTIDFNDKTKVTKYTPQRAKVSDIRLGTSGAATYNAKIVELEAVEFKLKAKKGE
jgi:hypothetical protein